jgi:hypothetical protein
MPRVRDVQHEGFFREQSNWPEIKSGQILGGSAKIFVIPRNHDSPVSVPPAGRCRFATEVAGLGA